MQDPHKRAIAPPLSTWTDKRRQGRNPTQLTWLSSRFPASLYLRKALRSLGETKNHP
ncbi:hypothetical protein [Tolypothrix sp. NIES-4075]|uniref:hypothetical protein n=1 Tax=Tolypothrix sp. NIES-4075 TaxID=2005459 RepID=UPI00135AAC0B|nr:hypothetical protein [Tolypothrix sp. NIES-4075]